MTVKVWDGEELDEEHCIVEAHFTELEAIKLDMIKRDDNTVEANYVVFKNVGDPGKEHNQLIMQLTGAKTVNLWYRMGSHGATLVDDIDSVIELEQALLVYEQQRKVH
jgi:hypothetical protein